MTRNNFGGTKHKKTARKNNVNNTNYGLRKSQDKDELYARAIKLYGNGMIEVLAQDNIKYLGIIRQKFSGKKKMGNIINVGTYLLIGRRSFETQIEGRKMKADILEIYDSKEIRKLQKDEVNIDWNIFYNRILDKTEVDNNTIEFEDEETNRGRQLLNELDSNDEETSDNEHFEKVNKSNIISFNNNDIDIDDI